MACKATTPKGVLILTGSDFGLTLSGVSSRGRLFPLVWVLLMLGRGSGERVPDAVALLICRANIAKPALQSYCCGFVLPSCLISKRKFAPRLCTLGLEFLARIPAIIVGKYWPPVPWYCDASRIMLQMATRVQDQAMSS